MTNLDFASLLLDIRPSVLKVLDGKPCEHCGKQQEAIVLGITSAVGAIASITGPRHRSAAHATCAEHVPNFIKFLRDSAQARNFIILYR